MNQKLKNSFLFNLLIVLLLCCGLYFLFFASLGVITNHGEEMKVPVVTGIPLTKANQKLTALGFEVKVDSSYDPHEKPFTVLSQLPDHQMYVKEGRTVFLTVNKASAPTTPMPKLTDLSYRSAVMILKANRLLLGDTTHKPDFAKGSVLKMLFKGHEVEAGDMVPQGGKIDLVIGKGFGQVELEVPDVIGMKADEGVSILNAIGVNVTIIWDGLITDSADAVIYAQNPPPFDELGDPNHIRQGDIIDIRIKQHSSFEEMEGNRKPHQLLPRETNVIEELNPDQW